MLVSPFALAALVLCAGNAVASSSGPSLTTLPKLIRH